MPERLAAFLDAVASSDPTPGGGTVSAVAAAMGAALVEMVCGLTIGRPKYAAAEEEMVAIREQALAARGELLRLAEKDSAAFAEVMAAMKLPKTTEEEKAARSAEMARTYRVAAEVPAATAALAAELLERIPALRARGNPNAASDALVAGLLLEAAIHGANANVEINLDSIKDEAAATELRQAIDKRAKQAAAIRTQLLPS